MGTKGWKNNKKDTIKVNKFFEVRSMCGDSAQAARLVGIGMAKAQRALSAPDGLDKLEKYNKKNTGVYYSLPKGAREAFLEKCWMSGLMPRVVFDLDTGEPTAEIVYETINTTERLKCLDMRNKMGGDYIEKREIIDNSRSEGKMTPEIREKLAEIYGDGVKPRLDYDPLD